MIRTGADTGILPVCGIGERVSRLTVVFPGLHLRCQGANIPETASTPRGIPTTLLPVSGIEVHTYARYPWAGTTDTAERHCAQGIPVYRAMPTHRTPHTFIFHTIPRHPTPAHRINPDQHLRK